MQNEQDLPIDIHTNKLLDWLISRRHCTREWSKGILAVREKINNAIQDMPAHEGIAKLLSGTHIHYFHCLSIIDILKETESETKNIFGRYSSQRMKDWQEIVSLYQRDNVYLAEAAQMLIRNVNYEIPSLKKHILKLKQVQQECERKEIDCMKIANESKEKYRSLCRQLEIKGENVRKELFELMKELPTIYSNIMAKCEKLANIKNYYESFSDYILGRTVTDSQLTPVLSFLLEKGNVTVYEWRHGKKPDVIEEPTFHIPSSQDETSKSDDAIDFGDDGGIDFGDDNQIDFGDDIEVVSENVDWNVNENFNEQVTVITEDGESGLARGDDALTLLDFAETRNAFINELLELEAFLGQRIKEMSMDSDVLSMNQFQSALQVVQEQTLESVESMLLTLSDAIQVFNDVKIQQLFLIRASPRYVDRLTASFSQKLELAEKMLQLKQIHIDKKNKTIEEEVNLLPKIDLIISRTKELHKHIEDDISKKYNNRPVNLMGGINTI